MKNLYSDLRDLANKGGEKIQSLLGDYAALAQHHLGKLPFLASSEQAKLYGAERFDEKHYFLIPFRLTELGYSFYSMRVLPDGVPPINALPKKRIFHFPSDQCTALVEHLLLEQIREDYADFQRPTAITFGDRLIQLANEIDKVDGRITGGMLLIGGLVALINPVVGAGLAAKALIPGMGTMLSKYGLKTAGERWNEAQLKKEIEQAENKVLAEFKNSTTVHVVNPILRELQLALDTSAAQHDPNIAFSFGGHLFCDQDNKRYTRLSCIAVTHTYRDVLDNKKQWEKACLGDEDIRWLKTIADMAARVPDWETPEYRAWQQRLQLYKERLREESNTQGLQRLCAIEEKFHRMVQGMEEKKETLEWDSIHVQSLAYEYLPHTMETYLRLPRPLAMAQKMADGRTAVEIVNAQLGLLDDALGDCVRSLFNNDARALRIQDRFLLEKFVQQPFKGDG